MTRDILVRGLDEEVHSKIANASEQLGMSVNSIIKDAADKWVSQLGKERHRHDLILYSDDESLKYLLSKMNELTETNWFKICCGPPKHLGITTLAKYNWLDGTIKPYEKFYQNPTEYAKKIIDSIKPQKNKQLLIAAFLTGDLANDSIKKSAKFCEWYDKKHVPGITHCIALTETIMQNKIEDILELFNCHEQIFVVKNKTLHRLRVTEENFYTLVV
ncbi:hypothetical protein [Candidatus Nitrosotenuis aquarius]|uniref:hypothetical protein n=1 Tax=Candidatus Nitrosotenuis aquarius TaxID=1846278 RepID=UPI000C1DE47A|nr:hypothetical protein [Candidatus Nitrosotenuis aquarius]